MPGVTRETVHHFVTGLSGALLLETRIDFARAVESWEQAVESWALTF